MYLTRSTHLFAFKTCILYHPNLAKIIYIFFPFQEPGIYSACADY